MRKYIYLLGALLLTSSLSAMVRAGVDVGPDGAHYYQRDGYYYYGDWYGPGYYYGVYYSDYPSYYGWQRRHYYGGPYYWRYNHRYDGRHRNWHKDGKNHGR